MGSLASSILHIRIYDTLVQVLSCPHNDTSGMIYLSNHNEKNISVTYIYFSLVAIPSQRLGVVLLTSESAQ